MPRREAPPAASNYNKGHSRTNSFTNIVKFMDVSSLGPVKSPEGREASTNNNGISIPGIHFAYISCCYVGQTSNGQASGCQEQPLLTWYMHGIGWNNLLISYNDVIPWCWWGFPCWVSGMPLWRWSRRGLGLYHRRSPSRTASLPPPLGQRVLCSTHPPTNLDNH